MFLGFLIFLLTICLCYHYWSFGYWKRKNVFSIKGKILFGNIKDVLLNRRNLPEVFSELYINYKSEGLIGFYSFYRPMLLITEPELIKTVLIKDFNSFYENGFRVNAHTDPMFGANPFCTTGLQNWKNVRRLHVPLHTPKKLKDMIQDIKKVGEIMEHCLKEFNEKPVEILEIAGNYAIDTVASCAYGFEPGAFSDPENGFKKHASDLYTLSSLANFSAHFFPTLAPILSLRMVTKHSEDFFISMVKLAKDIRMKTNSKREDLIGHLIKHNQKLLEENKKELSDLEFAGHCITFYLDGYESSASVLSFTLLELANHPDIQDKLRQKIHSAGNDVNDFSYEKINSLSYLTMVLNEVLRLHPVIPVLSRECTREIILRDRVVDKGTKVFIPVKCLHYDPELFEEPNMFDPQRFDLILAITAFLKVKLVKIPKKYTSR